MSATTVTTTSTEKKEKVIPDNVRGFLAGTASGISKLVTGHPLDTIKVRLQTEGGYGRFKGPIDCLKQTWKTEGIRGLYKGVVRDRHFDDRDIPHSAPPVHAEKRRRATKTGKAYWGTSASRPAENVGGYGFRYRSRMGFVCGGYPF